MKKVPQNSGTAPRLAPGSRASITCGLQWVPNRNCQAGTIEKKRALSNSRLATIPNVVRMAMSEAISSSAMMTRSTCERAAKSGLRRTKAKAPPAKASSSASAVPIQA